MTFIAVAEANPQTRAKFLRKNEGYPFLKKLAHSFPFLGMIPAYLEERNLSLKLEIERTTAGKIQGFQQLSRCFKYNVIRNIVSSVFIGSTLIWERGENYRVALPALIAVFGFAVVDIIRIKKCKELIDFLRNPPF